MTVKSKAAWIIILAALLARPLTSQALDQAVGQLASDIGVSLTATKISRIGVVEFTDLSQRVTHLGRLISEEIIGQIHLRSGGQIGLVERSKIREILGEQSLGVEGIVDASGARSVAGVLDVDAILTGTTAVVGGRVRINARLIAVPSGKLLATAATYMGQEGLEAKLFEAVSTETTEGKGPVAASQPAQRRDYKGITYELLGCRQDTRLIDCDLIITNNGADRKVEFDARDVDLFDQRGHSFKATIFRVADIERESNFEKLLITEVPTEAEIQFKGVPSTIEFIKLMYIRTSDGILEFRDLQFLKQ